MNIRCIRNEHRHGLAKDLVNFVPKELREVGIDGEDVHIRARDQERLTHRIGRAHHHVRCLGSRGARRRSGRPRKPQRKGQHDAQLHEAIRGRLALVQLEQRGGKDGDRDLQSGLGRQIE